MVTEHIGNPAEYASKDPHWKTHKHAPPYICSCGALDETWKNKGTRVCWCTKINMDMHISESFCYCGKLEKVFIVWSAMPDGIEGLGPWLGFKDVKCRCMRYSSYDDIMALDKIRGDYMEEYRAEEDCKYGQALMLEAMMACDVAKNRIRAPSAKHFDKFMQTILLEGFSTAMTVDKYD